MQAVPPSEIARGLFCDLHHELPGKLVDVHGGLSEGLAGNGSGVNP